MEIGEKIRMLRERSEMSQGELAKTIGVSNQAVSAWEIGSRIPRMGPIERMAKLFGVKKTYLMSDDEEDGLEQYDIFPVSSNLKPRLGTIACGQPILAVEEVGEYDEVPSFVNCDYTLVCKGDSMIGAGIHDGDVVYIRQQETVEQGQIAAVFVDGEVTLKHIYYNGSTVTLVAENPAYPPMVCTLGQDVRVLGLMMGYTHMVIRG